jgi:hypothetical protein
MALKRLLTNWKVSVLANMVRRRAYVSKREGVIGSSIELHNKDLHNLYSSTIFIRGMNSWILRCVTIGQKCLHTTYLVAKPDRTWRRFEENIILEFMEIGNDGVGWIQLAQNTD